MSTPVEQTITVVEAEERLRQESETFDQRKAQDQRWFVLRLAMGWTAVGILPGVDGICGWVIFNHKSFSSGSVTAATTALLVDTVGLVGTIWKTVIGKGPDRLGPVTSIRDEPPG